MEVPIQSTPASSKSHSASAEKEYKVEKIEDHMQKIENGVHTLRYLVL